jgi:RNA polymerase sigma-70 factor, ECF subfamily
MDEKDLLKAIAQLDQRALSDVFEHYAPLLFKYVFHLCRDPQESDDVVGETFSRLLDQLAEGKGPRENLRSYLYQTAYHIVVDRSRDNRHFSSFENLWDASMGDLLPAEQADEHRLLSLLQNAINMVLTDDQKHVIVLRFVEGFGLRETALILGKDINNIKVIQSRAVIKLRETLSQELEV